MIADFQKLLERGPWLIVISGAPGSGKSTLARRLSERLRIFHFERDVALEHMYQIRKHDSSYHRGKVGVPIYYKLVAAMLEEGVSVIADGTIYKGVSEAELKSLSKNSKMVNIHCRAKNEKKRFTEREKDRYGELPDWVPDHMQKLDEIYDDVVDPLDLGCPLLEVNTNKDYSPSIEEIVSFLGRLN